MRQLLRIIYKFVNAIAAIKFENISSGSILYAWSVSFEEDWSFLPEYPIIARLLFIFNFDKSV